MANEAFALIDEVNNDEDIFEDATSTEEEKSGDLPQKDDLLVVDQFQDTSNENEIFDEESLK